ncbi:hypothetical protein SAMN04515691_2986 [Leifsonia sp. 98AMF]|uniref:hypothetical protein n=1 Tax=unclassified Leifsonia TaxID=2663824 RepID=UPI00087B6D2D|nr:MULTISPECIES: hypothetical protein [unclassified Leifsonia]SDH16140.1 hypothetical protein SAMN04515690_1030 [Leifsonia sp. 197AMF]SDJ22136.1 hypothetical protein SAMN04515684_2752 [Leifsonia sp. 466MF]SDK61617.1 hypothetical protein SAMN04515683_4012 [Leifsonia sp. 157MF]SDN43823.1 hypothetical protein SAMN04515686_0936 [Leifsonia sp. 509MF]SEN67272.1 hypothetical protein SAMN04515685_3993 [Leifsonia sp. 467MF]
MTTRTLGPGSLKIGETGSSREWAGDLTKTSLSPDTSSEDPIPLLDGSNLDGEDTTAWTLGGTLVDDFDLDSLQAFALENAGKLLPFVWTPNDAATADFSGVIKIRPIGWGGDVKKKNTQDFEFPLIGDPTLAPSV